MPSPTTAMRWRDYVETHIDEFRDVMHGIPLPPGSGSFSTAEAFWLFRLVAELAPKTVVDSGSATGWSAFVIAAAAPRALIHCFDPYSRPTLLPLSAEYHDCDWSAGGLDLPPNTVALFDDHVNQRRRVLQARRAGIRDVVFHDVYRVLTKSTVSLAFSDIIGLAERTHTFDPLWFVDPMFTDTATNAQRYRWLTWVQLTPHRRLDSWRRARFVAQRHLARNPDADERSRLNWRAR